MFGWGDIVNFVKKVFHVVTSFVKAAVKVVTQAVKAVAAVVATVVTQYVKPAAAVVARGVAGAVNTGFKFVGSNADNIGYSLALSGLAVCTLGTAGLCAAAGSGAVIAVGASVSFVKATYEGNGFLSSTAYTAVNAGLGYVKFAGKGVEAVRWFGEGRQYKSFWTAMTGGQGFINNRALVRLGRQLWEKGAEVLSGGVVDWGYSKL